MLWRKFLKDTYNKNDCVKSMIGNHFAFDTAF